MWEMFRKGKSFFLTYLKNERDLDSDLKSRILLNDAKKYCEFLKY